MRPQCPPVASNLGWWLRHQPTYLSEDRLTTNHFHEMYLASVFMTSERLVDRKQVRK